MTPLGQAVARVLVVAPRTDIFKWEHKIESRSCTCGAPDLPTRGQIAAEALEIYNDLPGRRASASRDPSRAAY